MLQTLVELLPNRQLINLNEYGNFLPKIMKCRYSFQDSHTLENYCQLLRTKKAPLTPEQIEFYLDYSTRANMDEDYAFLRESFVHFTKNELNQMTTPRGRSFALLYQIETNQLPVAENFDFLLDVLPFFSNKQEALLLKIKDFLQQNGERKCSSTVSQTYYERVCQSFLNRHYNYLDTITVLPKIIDFDQISPAIRQQIKTACALKPITTQVRLISGNDNGCRAFILGNLAEAEHDLATAETNYRLYAFNALLHQRQKYDHYGEVISPLCKKVILEETASFFNFIMQPEKIKDLMTKEAIVLSPPLTKDWFFLDRIELNNSVSCLANLYWLDQTEFSRMVVAWQEKIATKNISARFFEKLIKNASAEQKEGLLQVLCEEGQRKLPHMAAEQTFTDLCYWMAKINEGRKYTFQPTTEKAIRSLLKQAYQNFDNPVSEQTTPQKTAVEYLISSLAAGGQEKESWQLLQKMTNNSLFAAPNHLVAISLANLKELLLRMIPKVKDDLAQKKKLS